MNVVRQGGEKYDVAGYSFVAQANYAGALNREVHAESVRREEPLRRVLEEAQTIVNDALESAR